MAEFNDQVFEKRLLNLKETQDSITGLSSWCLQQREHHKKIVTTWLKVLKKAKIEQRLVLFYLANDVIQYSKRKNLVFVESWGTALQKATTMVRDEKVKGKILRLFKIWNERDIYDESFLSDLCGLLTTNPKKNANSENIEFQPNTMFEKIRRIEPLEDITDQELQLLNENPLKLNDVKQLNNIVKERRTEGFDVDGELIDGINRLKSYIICLRTEISERTHLLEQLEQGEAFYETQKKEVKVVCNAYKNFGNRVKNMKRKLDELIPTLPSPLPSPDINAPSPSPEADIDLPEDPVEYVPSSNISHNESLVNSSDYYQPTHTSESQNVSFSYAPSSFSSGFTSFIGSTSLPFDLDKSLFPKIKSEPPEVSQPQPVMTTYEGNPIQVIGGPSASIPVPEPINTSVPPPTSAVPNTDISHILNLLKQPPPSVPANTPITPALSVPPPDLNIPPPDLNIPPPVLPPPQVPDVHNVPLAPPPMPPPMFDIDEFKTPDWLVESTSMSMQSNVNNGMPMQNQSGTPPSVTPPSPYIPHDPNTHPLPAKFPTWDNIDTPESPPSYEKDSYASSGQFCPSNQGVDIDNRSFPVMSEMCEDMDHRQIMTDMDHRNQNRNLISLTGSPAIDADYRTIPGPPNTRSGSNSLNKTPQVEGANTESVDMDLSEEEEERPSPNKALFKGSFSISSQKRTLPDSPLYENDIDQRQKKLSLLSDQDSAAVVDMPLLNSDGSMIKLDENAEKLLSSIDLESIANISKTLPAPRTPTPETKPKTPSTTPVPTPSTQFTPRNHSFNPRHRTPMPRMGGPGPRFRPRHQFDSPFRRGSPMGGPVHRFSPHMERGVPPYRPR